MTTPNSDKPNETKPVVVKKYANRRLYNTATSSYVTLDDLAKLIKEGGDFVAQDAKTGEDITRSVLTNPGHIETATTPWRLKSCAMSCAILSTPALPAP